LPKRERREYVKDDTLPKYQSGQAKSDRRDDDFFARDWGHSVR
jgi:hypothetical protein